jgi:DNA-binding response OmpR family regulator
MTKVLVVEDSQDISILLAHTLEDLGYSVIEARDGATGLRMARVDRPGIILLDIMMPAMDGIQVLEQLKSNAVTRSIPVIMVSAKGQDDDITKALQAGACSYVTKPWNLDELESKVATAEVLNQPAG